MMIAVLPVRLPASRTLPALRAGERVFIALGCAAGWLKEKGAASFGLPLFRDRIENLHHSTLPARRWKTLSQNPERLP